MESIINTLTSNSIFIVILVILAIVLIFSIIKRVFKLLVPILIIIGLYAGYLYMTGQKIPTTTDDIIDHSKKQIEKIKDEGGKLLDEQVKNKLKKK